MGGGWWTLEWFSAISKRRTFRFGIPKSMRSRIRDEVPDLEEFSLG